MSYQHKTNVCFVCASITITLSCPLFFGQFLVTSFGLQVVYDGKHTANIDLSYDYWTKTCGLCGTFDGDDGNEYRRLDGSQVRRTFSYSSTIC